MKRKNFLLVSFLAMAMTFSVASCSSSSDDPETFRKFLEVAQRLLVGEMIILAETQN